jgi:hypothetical protein
VDPQSLRRCRVCAANEPAPRSCTRSSLTSPQRRSNSLLRRACRRVGDRIKGLVHHTEGSCDAALYVRLNRGFPTSPAGAAVSSASTRTSSKSIAMPRGMLDQTVRLVSAARSPGVGRPLGPGRIGWNRMSASPTRKTAGPEYNP